MLYDVTVGIPFYAGSNKDQLRNSIFSIINQDKMVLAIHLIQDGPVNSEIENSIVEFCKHDNIHHIKFDENKGLANALNYSISLSKTKYYARMDCDDIAYPTRIKKQFAYMEQYSQIDVLGTWAVDIDEIDNELSIRKTPTHHEEIRKYIWTCPMIHPSVMFRRESLLKAGLYNEALNKRQDYELWFRLMNFGLRFANLSEPLLRYRNIINKNDSSVVWDQVKIGLKGCRDLKLSPIAYLGVMVPLLKEFLKKIFGIRVFKFFKILDPRCN